jgi:hypothetical protein
MGIFKSDGTAIFAVFIGAIITLVLIGIIADQVTDRTRLATINNATITVPATANTTLELTGRDLVSRISITNRTNITSDLLNEGLALEDGIGSNGLKTVRLRTNDSASVFGYLGAAVNVSYTYNPEGSVRDNSGAASITLLITMFSALAIMIFTIVVFVKSGSMGNLIRRMR